MKERYRTPGLLLALILITLVTVGRGATETVENQIDIPDDVSTGLKTSFSSIFKTNNGYSDEVALLKTVPSLSSGGIQDSSLILDKMYVASFSVDSRAAGYFQLVTDQVISPGDYFVILFELLSPPNIPDLIYQFGIGMAPAGADTTVSDADSIEPIAKAPQTSAVFILQEPEWQRLTVLDVNEGFEQTGNVAYAYFDDTGTVGAVVVSQNAIGAIGDTTNLTFEIFGRKLFQKNKTEDNWLGISGFTTPALTLPEPQDSQLFVDGFLRGETSEWAESIL